MKTKIFTFLTVILLIAFNDSNAQDYENGYAVLNDGTKISGMVSYNEKAPWLNQRFIWVMDSVQIAAGNKGKAKKYNADDLKLYEVGGRKFVKIHFVDINNLQIKSMGTNDHMMEQFSSGKINAYRFYSYPKDIEVYLDSEAEIREKQRQDKEELLSGWKLLTQKEGDKLRNSFEYDFKKYFEDSPEVLKKYNNGEYGNKPLTNKKGIAGKMMNIAVKNNLLASIEYESIILAFNEYNQINK